MASLMLNSKLCSLITSWNLIKAQQDFVQWSFSIKLTKTCHKNRCEVLASGPLKVRVQCFSEKFLKEFFFQNSYFFWKDLSKEYLVVSKFLLEVPKFKVNVIICVITVTKVHDILLTLTHTSNNKTCVCLNTFASCTYLPISYRRK